ncbi:hypothetical protein J6TS1_08780 [Siminovitchia terrae]|uniref:DUF3973 domain-containing protein n=1 Tax=Siminovitchia terrae TaxID=1914933 RepID=A0A429X3I5_SIMTE|nr:DUF3973 domain-containing protein [Siminovitchia terrae]RST57939.1 DUF3973 domain-containing protein [Siminovitchia terrae]GIN91067.1 hypothetical protein J22TS1_21180 [Siminovitchia terrae]GIN95008.1 hypothetical protein J6TS1_08780 [Siminovitchia terrae]
MFYCIVCSKPHDEMIVESKVFEKGFYIDPFWGEKMHLGMCGKDNNMEIIKDKITQNTIQESFPELEKLETRLNV